ncbi:MAG: hypothetical protein ACTIH2_05720 [Anaerococcus sp.]
MKKLKRKTSLKFVEIVLSLGMITTAIIIPTTVYAEKNKDIVVEEKKYDDVVGKLESDNNVDKNLEILDLEKNVDVEKKEEITDNVITDDFDKVENKNVILNIKEIKDLKGKSNTELLESKEDFNLIEDDITQDSDIKIVNETTEIPDTDEDLETTKTTYSSSNVELDDIDNILS